MERQNTNNNTSEYFQKISDFYFKNSKMIAIISCIISEFIFYVMFINKLNLYNNIGIILLFALLFLTIFKRNLAIVFFLFLVVLPFGLLNPLYIVFMFLCAIVFFFALDSNISSHYLLIVLALSFAFFGTVYFVIPISLFLVFFIKEGKLFSISYPLIITTTFLIVKFNDLFIETMNTVIFTTTEQFQLALNDTILFQSYIIAGSSAIQSMLLYAIIAFLIIKAICILIEEVTKKIKKVYKPVLLIVFSTIITVCLMALSTFQETSSVNFTWNNLFIILFFACVSVLISYPTKSFVDDQYELDELQYTSVNVDPSIETIPTRKQQRTKEEEFAFLALIGASLSSILNELLNEAVKGVAIDCYGETNWFQEIKKIMNANPTTYIDPTAVLNYLDMDATKSSRLLTDNTLPMGKRLHKYNGLRGYVKDARQARNNIAHNTSVKLLDVSYIYVILDSCRKLRACLYSNFPNSFDAETSSQYLIKINKISDKLKEY